MSEGVKRKLILSRSAVWLDLVRDVSGELTGSDSSTHLLKMEWCSAVGSSLVWWETSVKGGCTVAYFGKV